MFEKTSLFSIFLKSTCSECIESTSECVYLSEWMRVGRKEGKLRVF